MQEYASTINGLERRIDKAFARLEGKVSVSASEILKEVDITPLTFYIFKNYSEPWRYRHDPKIMLKATVFMRLRGMKFQTQLIQHLNENPQDARNLGCFGKTEKRSIPNRRTFNHFMSERLTKDVWSLVEFAVKTIRDRAVKKGILLDNTSPEARVKKDASKRMLFRKKHEKLNGLCKLMRRAVYPRIRLDIARNSIYKKRDFLDLMTHVGLTHDFAENGSATMRLARKAPNGDTLLYHIKKYRHRQPVEEMYRNVFDLTIEMAKRNGYLKGPVELAIDYTDILYYGDRHDYMVVGTKPERGAQWAFKFATVNVVTNGQRFVLYAVPVPIDTRKVEVVRKLLEYAKRKVKIKRVYMDRGFYSADVIAYMNMNRLEFLMPAVKHWRQKRIMKDVVTPAVLDFKLKSKWSDVNTWFRLVILTDEKGEKRAFATNMKVSKLTAWSLFEKYSRRWGIETAYRVKEVFRPRTTSKNYVVRLFYFMFSQVFYNLWVLINSILSMFLFGKHPEKPLVTAKMVGMLLYLHAVP